MYSIFNANKITKILPQLIESIFNMNRYAYNVGYIFSTLENQEIREMKKKLPMRFETLVNCKL